MKQNDRSPAPTGLLKREVQDQTVFAHRDAFGVFLSILIKDQ